MAETTAEEYFPHDSYHPQWFLFWLLAIAAAVLLWLNFFRPTPVTAPPQAAVSAGYDWFLVLRMPEVPQNPAKAAALQKTFGSWLEALAKEGYHPMLLSDVQERMKRGQGLPQRAVVLVFEPAYFHSYELLAPILVRYRFPALWVTDHTAILRGDRHYIHRHQTKEMVHSGYWDLGYTGDGFWGRTTNPNEIIINETQAVSWLPDTGRTALNWGTDLPHLKRLDVSPKWTPDELITRLDMELPLQGTVRLGAKHLQDRLWGVVITSPEKNNVFSLQSPLDSTQSNLYWFGTRGAADVQLDVSIPSFFGQLSLWLRSDRKTNQGIGIGFTHQEIYVDQKIQGAAQRLASMHWTPPSGGIQGRITLAGHRLKIAFEGTDPLEIALAPALPSPTGMVRMGLFDRVRGAASAEFVNLTLTLLSKPPH
jgi:hypothetical protein